MNTPSYVALLESGELERRSKALSAAAGSCRLCPRECRVARDKGERGWCGAGHLASLVSVGPHHGEENCLSGSRGSGTLFLGYCNLRCLFCQNYEISQDTIEARSRETTDAKVAEAMLQLQSLGCHNINWVSPTHHVAALVRALAIAARKGLRIPVVYNTNGYDAVETLKLLDGIVDIYMPDLKYAHEGVALRLSNVADYVARARTAIREMHRQVGDMVLGNDGSARRGLLIRHLVLPEDLSGSADTLTWIAETIGRSTTVNLMSQYHPAHEAARDPRLSRGLTRGEYETVVDYARRLRMTNILTHPRLNWIL